MSKEPKGPGHVQVYTGEGKGKTTASLGLCLRALGQGYKVYVIQFMKSWDTGELYAVKKYLPGMTIVQFGQKAFTDEQPKTFEYDGQGDLKPFGTGRFYFPPDVAEEVPAGRALDHAFDIVKAGAHDVVVLDEVNVAMHRNIIPTRRVLELIEGKPSHIELILTGRDAPKEIRERADLVTVMRPEKHYFDAGILARRGIEF